MARIASTKLEVFPLGLGGNVFGWTADEKTSFSVLNAYAAAGDNFIDTADVYSAWVPGNSGGESEAIIGRWLKDRGNRARMIISTKVGMHPKLSGLSPRIIRTAAEESLRRLQTDCIDLYYAHVDDENTPLEETLRTFDQLVQEGKIRYVGASNYSAARLQEALAISDRTGLVRYVALQQHYNLVERDKYEGELADLVAREGLSSIPYFALASGFLTGKYRPGAKVGSPRAERAGAYLNDKGIKILAMLDEVAAAHAVSVASVALAWLAAQPTVVAPLASARTADQLPDLLQVTDFKLTKEELARLSAVSS